MYLSTTISAVSCNKIKNKTPSFLFFINYSNKLRVVNFISDVTCASYMDEMSCNKGCGVGSGNGKCRWRSGDERGYSRKFSTCVSDLTTCTDHMCDDRESLDILICPQDCTSKGTFPFYWKNPLAFVYRILMVFILLLCIIVQWKLRVQMFFSSYNKRGGIFEH